ncbi:MAG: hypothetical protein U0414_26120 [Polyangiaceae bacterium]
MRPTIAVVSVLVGVGVALELASGCGGAPAFVERSPGDEARATSSADRRPPTLIATVGSALRPPMTLRTGTPVVLASAEPDPSACSWTIPASLGAGCRVLTPVKLSATSNGGTAINAFDQSTCTAWSAGAPAPQ